MNPTDPVILNFIDFDRSFQIVQPDPFVVADTRMAIDSHVAKRNRFDKQRQLAQGEREIAEELERMG